MNIPNILTTVRIILVPVYLWFFYTFGENKFKYAILILTIAGITDILDGYIARKYNMITRLGTVLDPIADKLTTFAVLISLSSEKLIPIWILLVLVIKELILLLGGSYIYCFKDKKIVSANKFGKIASASFYLAVFFIILDINPAINNLILYLMVIMHLIALTNYLLSY